MKTLFSVLLICFMMFNWGCEMEKQSWNTEKITNDLIKIQVVPEIGGRVIQYELGNYHFFWNNPELVNTTPPESGLGPDDSWLNYGGEKLWPAPQGWDNDQQWPGPPDAVLDGGPYAAEYIVDSGKKIGVKLTSQKDKQSGIQFSRVIKTFENTTRVSIDATMTNIDNKPRRWGIWSVAQMDAADRHGDGHNRNLHAYCTLNPDSKFYKGYNILFGLVNNPTFVADKEQGMFKAHYQRQVGKAVLDSPGGWVAVVNAEDGYVFIQKFTYEPDKPYPDDATVEFWSHGLGDFYAWDKMNTMPEDPKLTPYFFESEIISPFATLQPGEKYSFHYDWYCCRIASDLPVTDCSDVGVICEPLSAVLKDSNLSIKGKFGVFYNGTLKISVLDNKGENIEVLSSGIEVSPLKPLDLNVKIDNVTDPSKIKAISVVLLDKNNRLIGELAKAQISE